MATTMGNKDNAPGSSLTATAAKSKISTWAERVEEFTSNLNENNTFNNDDGARFFFFFL